jgi:hypothetical protein
MVDFLTTQATLANGFAQIHIRSKRTAWFDVLTVAIYRGGLYSGHGPLTPFNSWMF